jgi:hypothetical protein
MLMRFKNRKTMSNLIGELLGLIFDGIRDFFIGKAAQHTRPWSKRAAWTLIIICIALLFLIPLIKKWVDG